jgi:hypothetical protein
MMKKQNVSIIEGLIDASNEKLWLPEQIIASVLIEIQVISDMQEGYA